MENKEKYFFSFWLNLGNKTKNELQSIFYKLAECGIDEILATGSLEKTKLAIPLAAEKKIKFQHWQMTMINNDPQILKEHKDWFMINRDGKSSADYPPYVNYYHWLCPNNLQVKSYLNDLVASYCSLPGLKGIHLDYIRYPDVILPVKCQRQYGLLQQIEESRFDFCYCPYCLEKFQALYDKDINTIIHPDQDENWRHFRWQSISEIVDQLIPIASGYGKKITAAVFPTPDIARKLVRQNWAVWLLDAFYPMMYHEFYDQGIDWLAQAVIECRKETDRPVHVGIYLFALASEQLQQAIKLLISINVDGISFFDFHTATDDKLEIIKSFKISEN